MVKYILLIHAFVVKCDFTTIQLNRLSQLNICSTSFFFSRQLNIYFRFTFIHRYSYCFFFKEVMLLFIYVVIFSLCYSFQCVSLILARIVLRIRQLRRKCRPFLCVVKCVARVLRIS